MLSQKTAADVLSTPTPGCPETGLSRSGGTGGAQGDTGVGQSERFTAPDRRAVPDHRVHRPRRIVFWARGTREEAVGGWVVAGGGDCGGVVACRKSRPTLGGAVRSRAPPRQGATRRGAHPSAIPRQGIAGGPQRTCRLRCRDIYPEAGRRRAHRAGPAADALRHAASAYRGQS